MTARRLAGTVFTFNKVRSIVGLLPLCAVTVLSPDVIERFPTLAAVHVTLHDRDLASR